MSGQQCCAHPTRICSRTKTSTSALGFMSFRNSVFMISFNPCAVTTPRFALCQSLYIVKLFSNFSSTTTNYKYSQMHSCSYESASRPSTPKLKTSDRARVRSLQHRQHRNFNVSISMWIRYLRVESSPCALRHTADTILNIFCLFQRSPGLQQQPPIPRYSNPCPAGSLRIVLCFVQGYPPRFHPTYRRNLNICSLSSQHRRTAARVVRTT
jgi:hypothetical protein